MKFRSFYLPGLILALCLLLGSSCRDSTTKPAPPADIDYRTPEQKIEPPFTREGTLIFKNERGLPQAEIAIEIAEKETDRQMGLMYRKQMAEDQGMLFIMEAEEPQSFWMKDTYISLDIIFADADFNIVAISERCPTLTEALFKSRVPAKYVIEVVAGYCDKHDIQVGDQFSYTRTPA